MVCVKVRQLDDGRGGVFRFVSVRLFFASETRDNIFADYTRKTLGRMLAGKRYKKLASEAYRHFADSMDEPLGSFLLRLKKRGDDFYKQFLNEYGDSSFRFFRVEDSEVLGKKGIYAFYVGDELRYVGRCKDNMDSRINWGYGEIHPRGCYKDGQSTNCRLNAEINKVKDRVSLWFCSLDSCSEIESVELALIEKHNPPWNKSSGGAVCERNDRQALRTSRRVGAVDKTPRIKGVGVRGKYEPLYAYLCGLNGALWRASFAEVEGVLGSSLPSSAYRHSAWWANQRDGNHSHALAWLTAGYQTSSVNLGAETLTFQRSP